MADGSSLSPSHAQALAWTGSEIAVVGMACRFPGAANPSEFWRNLRDGVESITRLSGEELLRSGADPIEVRRSNYVRAAPLLDGVELFDAAFFGYTPLEAKVMDPQQRLLLECAWAALEDAGYDTGQYKGSIGVYAGAKTNTYLFHLAANRELLHAIDFLQLVLGGDLSMLSTRLSYKLDLRGPSYAVQTACSTSLVAVHLACQSLLIDECQMALVGGVAINVPHRVGYLHEEGGILSPDGHCRPFDARAQGTVFGSGVGVVVLKRLANALADGDAIRAVILGSATNNDGSVKATFTAPSVEGQSDVILEALACAGITADTISYVEAHGTGTQLGDPIEVLALTNAFRASTGRMGFCAIGSVKSNVGHLDAAAGMSGLIKTILALENGYLPPSLHFREPNPEIDFTNSPFYVNGTLRPWEADGKPRRAGVSSFGFGGTNAHVILQEAPPCEPASPARPWKLLPLSARTATALDRVSANLAAALCESPALPLGDVAYTLQVGRKEFAYRRFLVCRDREDALATLEQRDPAGPAIAALDAGDRRPVFLFSGQGGQYVHMAQGLYDSEPTFCEHLDRCAELLRPHLGTDLREVLYPGPGIPQAGERLQQTAFAQVAIFSVEYALARLLMDWGIRPQAMLGHSIGEYVAACLAGVFRLEDALPLVAERGRLMQEMPAGAMLAVPLPDSELARLLGSRLSLAAINTPDHSVAAGPEDDIAALELALAKRSISCRRLHTSHAFHSAMMEPVVAAFRERLRKVPLSAPQIPFLSNVTGSWITPGEAMDPAYWAEHLRRTVLFAQGLERLFEDPEAVLLEVGPGTTLSTFARKHPSWTRRHPVLSTLPHPKDERPDAAFLLRTLGSLWSAGVRVNWTGFNARERRRRVPLPTYPFEGEPYWLDADPPPASVRRIALDKRPDIADWLYRPVWKPSVQPSPGGQELATKRSWLIFEDGCGLGSRLGDRLASVGQLVVRVWPGERFQCVGPGRYQIGAGSRNDYLLLMADLQARGEQPERIIHLWMVTPVADTPLDGEALEDSQESGFYSLLSLAQALARRDAEGPITMAVVSNGLHNVIGREAVCPEKATLLGPCRVLPKELPGLTCRSIDVEMPPDKGAADHLADLLLAELTSEACEGVVALRDHDRWVESFEPLSVDKAGKRIELRHRGVYLVTGGLGGLGLVFAEHLARQVAARIVLVGRSGLPPREQWAARLGAESGGEDQVSRRIRKIQELEALGSEVLAMAADVADRTAMEKVVAQARERFGTIHGVVHAAGIAGEGLMQWKTQEAAARVLRPKVQGALVLRELFQGAALDFTIYFSSLQSVLGDLGQADYCAANAFLDALAQYDHARGELAIAIGWDNWREVGVAVDTAVPPELQPWREEMLAKAIAPEEGLQVFSQILERPVSRVVISTQELDPRIELSAAFTQRVILEELGAQVAGSSSRRPPLRATGPTASRAELERRIAAVWSEVLGVPEVGLHDNFFDLGGNSLSGMQLVSELKRQVGAEIAPIVLFEAPSVAALARHLAPGLSTEGAQPPAAARQNRERQEIAIIGMSGRFPGARNLAQFWRNLCAGVESVTFFSAEELASQGVDPAQLADPRYVCARPVLDRIEWFDARFFDYSPREAELMDPQHRLFLECAWEALESAGCDPRRYPGAIGVYAGASLSTYLLALHANPALAGRVDPMQAIIGNDKDSLTTSVSYKLDLKGPSLAVQTFCSTSLVALHLACQGLAQGECDLALAGGVSIAVPQESGYVYQDDGILSPDGHCRPFDAGAGGTLFGNGLGIVVLKRLADALADGDLILAVVKGSAINNDGSLKVGYTAPSVDGQARVIAAALKAAEVEPGSIDYIEAHGTGTALGDPIEVAALTKSFRATGSRGTGFCALGSVKGNIGHLDRASGIASLIKTVLALQHGILPPSLHFAAPNPKLDLAGSPFYVQSELAPWPNRSGPRRAGVSSLGFGGTNAHVVLEEAPPASVADSGRAWHLLPLSAKTASALETATDNLATFLEEHRDIDLADSAFTLQVGRGVFNYRRVIVCRDAGEAVERLRLSTSAGVGASFHASSAPGVAFLFPGQGAQYPGMGRELYRSEAVFRAEVDRCAELLLPSLGTDLREFLDPLEESLEAAERRLAQTEFTQPALFTVEYALARLWMSWGVSPQMLLGHSVGEYVAACLAGVFSLEDALELVAARGRLVQRMPCGGMLGVALSAEELAPLLGDELCLAAINAPRQCVLAGPPAALERAARSLASQGTEARLLHTSHAFHSAMLAPVVELFRELVSRLERRPPELPFISCTTGTWITAEEAVDPDYWAAHLLHTVRFSDGIREILSDPQRIILEVGPGATLTSLVRRHLSHEDARPVVSSMRRAREERSDVELLVGALGRLWLAGVEPDWQGFHAGQRRRRVALPTYPFERQRFWLAPDSTGPARRDAERPPEEWFHTPSWKRTRTPKPLRSLGGARQEDRHWLVLADELGLAPCLIERLERQDRLVVAAQAREAFLPATASPAAIRPDCPQDYAVLLRQLAATKLKLGILHLWSLAPPLPLTWQGEPGLSCRRLGSAGLSALERAVQELALAEPVDVWVVSRHLCQVLGDEELWPERAPLLAQCRELNRGGVLRCRILDVAPGSGEWTNQLADLILEEVRVPSHDFVAAYRGPHRWVPMLERVAAEPYLGPPRPFLVVGGLEGPGFGLLEVLVCEGGAKLTLIEPGRMLDRMHWMAGLASGEEWGTVPREEHLRMLAVQRALPFDLAREREGIERQARHHASAIEPLPAGLEKEVDRLCGAFLASFVAVRTRALQGSSWSREELSHALGIQPRFERFLDFMLTVLVEDEVLERVRDSYIFVRGAAELPDPEALRQSLDERYPIFRPISECLSYCARHFSEVLDGRTDPLSVLYPEGSSGMLHAVMEAQTRFSSVEVYRKVIAHLLRDLTARTPERSLRIIEVGAGDGNLTWGLADHLQEQEIEYYFTDVGKSLVLQAERTASRRGLQGMKFGVLDISQDPAQQGFANYGFDVVLALNAVHATPEIGTALGHLRQLLAPGGLLLLLEPTRVQRWVTMIWGLNEGWWSYVDLELRQSSPLLSPTDWERVLGQLDLHTTAVFPLEGRDRAAADHSLLIAQQTVHPSNADQLAWVSVEWEQQRQQTAMRLQRLQVLEDLGGEILRLTVDAGDEEQLRAALACAEDRFGRIEGVIAAPWTAGRRKDLDRAMAVLASLDRALQGRELDLALVISPVDVLHRREVEDSHAAFDQFAACFAARARQQRGIPWTSVGWDGEEQSPVFRCLFSVTDLPRCVVTAACDLETWNRIGAPAPAGDSVTETYHPRPDLATHFLPPRTEEELLLAQIWREVLGVEHIGVQDNFLELGGDSLIAAQLNARIREMFGVKIPLSKLFELPTVAGMARAVADSRADQEEEEKLAILASIAELSDEDVEAELMKFQPAHEELDHG